MPLNGPFFTSVNTNTATPTLAGTDPPTAMVATQNGLSLVPKEWFQNTVSASTLSSDFNNSDSTPTATNSAITFVPSSGAYANGNNYAAGHVFHATPAAGTIYNGGFETNTNSPTWTSGAAVTQDGWTAFGSNATGFTIVEVTGGKTGGGHQDAGSNYGFIQVSGTAGRTSWIQLLDATAVTELSTVTTSTSTAYTTISLSAGNAVVGRAVRLRLIVTTGATQSGQALVGATGYAYLMSDPFIYDGTSITVRFKNSLSGSTSSYYFDTCSNGRANYSGSHVFTSQIIRTYGFSTTHDAQTKTFYEAEIEFDIPAASSSLGVPTGHGARLDFEFKTGTGSTDSYAALANGPYSLLSNFTTTSSTGQKQIVKIGPLSATAAPYMRYRVTLNSGVAAPSASANTGTVTPVIKRVKFKFFNANANWWWSQQTFLGTQNAGLTKFLANVTQSSGGSATFNYRIRTGATATALNTASWSAIISGDDPSGTDDYCQIAAQIVPAAAATTLPTIDALAVAWDNSGEISAAPPASAWHNRRYWLSLQERNFTFNNRVWVYDSRGAWTKFGNINASALVVFKDQLLIGQVRAAGAASDLADGRIVVYGGSPNDNGTSVQWHIRTKDIRTPDMRSPVSIRGVEIAGRGTIPQTYPTVGSGLTGFGYNVVLSNWFVNPIIGGQGQSPQFITMYGAGQEMGQTTVAANRWGATVGVVVNGQEPGRSAQIDSITINAWVKEPTQR